MLGDIFVKLAWIDIVCGFPGDFEKLNVILKLLLSNATIDR
uniref:AP-1 complex subunit gamma-2 n=1 Tax=Rhizophora mucronata TaxID=61149 RepID=A0A2P2ML61_RHIMU